MDSQMLLEERRLVDGADTFESHKFWSSIRFTTKGLATKSVIFGPIEGPNSNGLCVLIGVLFREKETRSSVSSEIDPTNQIKLDLITFDHALYGEPSRVPSAFGLIWLHDFLSLNFPFFQCCKSLLHTVEANKSHSFATLPAELGTRYLNWSDYDAELVPKMIVFNSLHRVPVPSEVPVNTLVSFLTMCLNLLSTAITTEIYAKFEASALWLSRLVPVWQNRRLTTMSSFIMPTKVSHRRCNCFPHGSWTSTKHPSPPRAIFGSVLLRTLFLLLLWTRTAVSSMFNSNGQPSLSTAANIPTSEWNALYDLYNATNGLNWRWSKNPVDGIIWNFTSPVVNNPCVDHWQGISCKYSPQNEFYHVTKILLPSYRLAGQLLPSLNALSELVSLDLNTNKLTGTIPESLGSLSELVSLNLYTNMLTGTIPESLGSLTQLQELYLYINKLTGSLPESLGSLTQLQDLYLYTNLLTGPVHESLGNLAQLQILFLNNNLLTGPIPESLGNLTQLKELDLYINILTGPIPESLGGLSELLILSLNNNMLTGPLPESLGNLTRLEYMYLDTNMLTGSITKSLGNLTQLQKLDLYANRLTGPIPKFLGDLTELLSLDLDTNKLTGPIPESLGGLKQLQTLYLQANKLTGTIPDSLGGLAQLLELFLYTNYLIGPLPESLGGLSNLLNLALYSNNLSGPIPDFLSSLIKLQALYLFNNKLTGSIPESLGYLVHLQYLDLHANKLTGLIPHSLCSLIQLEYLDLSSNILSGTILNASLWPSLRVVELQNNRFTGNLEGMFDPITQLQVEMISLNGNQLTGTLPESIFRLELESFSAIENCFEGPLPISALCNSTYLTNLILDGLSSATSCQNKLLGPTYTLKYAVGGSVPVCLFQLPNITTLHLSGNGFTGSIPNDIVVSNTLSDLSLSHNALTGSIPHQLQLRKWSNIDLSFNRLSDVLLPSFASNGSISLDNNRLSGHIPASFYTLHNISVLGSNMFTCSYDESNLPQHDPGRERYHCGSNSFNSIFYTWLGAISCAAVLLGYFKCMGYIHDEKHILSGSILRTSVTKVCRLSLTSFLYSMIVLLPAYSACSRMYGTQTYTYAYQVSAVFMSGVVPFAVNFCLWVALLLILKLMWFNSSIRDLTLQSINKRALDWRTAVLVFLPYHVLNCLVVVGANAAYVYVAVYKGGSLLLVTQTLLSVFKIIWARWTLPFVLSVLQCHAKNDAVHVSTDVLVNILNNVVIPCLVVAAVSPNCFYYALVTAPPVESIAVNANCIFVDPNTQLCLQYNYVFVPTSYRPPFIYNYQCSSSLLTYYSPAFLSMCIVSTFVTPLAQYTCLWLYERSTAYPYRHRLLSQILPKIMKPIDFAAEEVSKSRFLNSSVLMTSLIGFLALILTFGVMFPPLCVALTVSVLASVFLFKVNVQRFVNSASKQQRDKILELLQAECNSVESMQMLKYSIWVLVTVSCWFYTLFLFDTLGDAVGFKKAYWVLIVMPLMPLILYVVYLVVCKYCINVNGWDNKDSPGPDHHLEQAAVEVEMPTISVVHNVLVVGAEKGDGSDC